MVSTCILMVKHGCAAVTSAITTTAVADPDWGSGGSLETKLFHFNGIFKKNEIKSEKQVYTFLLMNPFPEILDPPPGLASDMKNICLQNILHLHDFSS